MSQPALLALILAFVFVSGLLLGAAWFMDR